MFRRLFLPVYLLAAVLIAHGSVADENKAVRQLKWPSRSIKIHISSSLFASSGAIKGDSDVNGAVLRALQRWESVVDIEFQVTLSDITSISPRGAAGDGISLITIGTEPENLLVFSGRADNSSGLTRVFHDARGSITEADIALNTTQLFTTDKTPGTFDLESVLTHEIGHLLGLPHSADAGSVMFDGVPRNQAFDGPGAGRSLSADDRAKIRRIYGTGYAIPNCCAKVSGRVNATAGNSTTFQLWIQDARTGALVEVNLAKPNKFFDFANLSRGSYEVVAQSYSNAFPSTEAVHFGVREVVSEHNLAANASGNQVAFDISYIGIAELSKRSIRTESGNSYRVILAGPGLNSSDMQFGTTSKNIILESVKEESWTNNDGLIFRVFQMHVPRSTPPGEYSLFAQAASGARRYFVGGIAVN